MAGAINSVVAQTTTPLRPVLVLYSDERLLPASMIVDETILARSLEVGPARTRNEILKELDPLKPLQFALFA